MQKLIKKIKINSVITLKTGLHIGGNNDSVEIGGIDNPVIKLQDGKPYIPGSSLKGKIRCLLEQSCGVELGGDAKINNMFGSCNSKNPQPSKVIFRDAYLTEKSIKKLSNSEYLAMPYTESKAENSIDRCLGKAANPRFTERIPAGVSFNVEIILNIWDNDKSEDLKKMLEDGIKLLEADYLGGSGSRGYGQVVFSELEYTELSAENNWQENKEQ